MFNRARLKLTAWYLLIIMIVSLAFSIVIYRVVSDEVDRFAESQRFRFERRIYIRFPDVWQYTEPEFDAQLIGEIKRHILTNLARINAAIFVSAGVMGYYLAGRTLKPIQDMVNEQYRFISDASHELKTPLTAMRTNLEVNLREKKLSSQDAKTALSENLAEVIKLQNLSENLLDLTPRASGVMLKKQSVGPIVMSAINEVTPLASDKNIAFSLTGKQDALVHADEQSLRRALIAVLDNAIKYSQPDKKVEIHLKKSNDSLTIVIKDQGIGIKKKDLPRITQRFFRADTSRSTKGHGLGLSIVEKIVTTHQGKVTFQSKQNVGTTVTVSLPIA